MTEDIKQLKNDYWHYFFRTKDTNGIMGKYLFFSNYKNTLEVIAKNEINNHRFNIGKISVNARNGSHVLCLYWFDDTRKNELAERYMSYPNIQYRFWKTDEQTRKETEKKIKDLIYE